MLYLKELTEIGGVSGDESRVRDFIASKIKDKVDETHVDKLGNLIALKKGKKNGKRFLLTAHMDEIGFMVTNIEDDGTLSFSPIGGVDPRVVPGKRVKIVREKSLTGQIQLVTDMLKRQPFWRYRWMAIFHELQASFITNMTLNPKKIFNKARWKGEPGWGPRFKSWQTYLNSHTPIEFNAMQWVQSVEAVFNSWSDLPEKNKIEIRYEDLIQSPKNVLQKLFDLINVAVSPTFFDKIPEINHKNLNKWKTELSHDEIQKIKPILSPLINRLGYDKKYPW